MKLLNAVKYFLIIMCIFHLTTTSSFASSSGFALRQCMVMEEPYRDANEIASLDKGDSLEILKRKGGWLKISTGDIQGWVRMFYIKRGEEDNKPSAGTEVSGALGLATGRAGSGNVVATTGIRGLDEENLKEAEFNAEELKKLKAFYATNERAEAFAKKAKLVQRKVALLPAPRH